MRLQRLELKGFKSFARETVLHFNENITGIVGPNGSGKSNIVDAIRWVLGEQKTRELRLDKMGDVLFNGTKKRKAAPVAKVSVTFDNDKGLIASEYSELTISRFLYRSGESEYRLNDVPCRLKDIRSVLMDTGIGSNTYAIIALGMVEDILDDKEQARMRMFEQAAGISKFKSRKKESLQKLQLATSDLERVEDLLHEISSNLRRLKREASKAEKYLNLKQEYKVLCMDSAVINSAHWREQYSRLEKQLSEEQDAMQTKQNQIHSLQAQLEEEKQTNLRKESKVTDRQKVLSELTERIRQLEGDRKMRQQKVDFSRERMRQLKQQIEDHQKSIREDQNLLESALKKEKEVAIERNQKKSELEKKKAQKRDRQQAFSVVKEKRSAQLEEQNALEEKLVNAEREKAVLSSRLQEIENRRSRNKNELERLKEELKKEENAKSELEVELDKVRREAEQFEQTEEERKQRGKQLETEEKSIREDLREVQRKWDAVENEYELTKSLVDNLEGFPESARFLKKNKKWAHGAPLFSDILFCDDALRPALENYLEKYLSYFIVDQPSSAVEAIELLKEAQKGKAHFFINRGKSEATPNKRVEISGASPVLDQVEVDENYRALVTGLLRDVYFWDGDVPPEELIRIHPEITLISRDGSMICNRNQFSGGSSGLFEGKRLGRKKNLEKLRAQSKQLERRSHELEAKLQKALDEKALIENQNQEEQLKLIFERQRKLEHAVEKHSIRAENIQNQRAHLVKEQEESDATGKKIREQQRRNEELLDKTRQSLKGLQSTTQEIQSHFSKEEEAYSKLSEEVNQSEIELIRIENTLEQYQNRRSYKESEIQRLEKEVSGKGQELSDLEKELSEIAVRNTEEEEELEQLYKKKSEAVEALSKAERVYFEARNAIVEKEKEIREIQSKVTTHQELIQKIKDQLAEVRLKLHGVSERLKVEFDISLEEIKDRPLSRDWKQEELNAKLEKVRAKLANFGEVNPMALSAYEEMKERRDLISGQRQDILDAQEKLKNTISEIEETATRRFMEAFEKIRTYFIDVFRTLFTEDDRADLVLTDPEHPLESQIDIIARPKGKRPKSLSQLSGGEKTLTATALLFALYLLKPAPFCVFDEVDAPLDDANIEKFNKIIQKFSRESQFVIVTHNKSTMAAVDIIYGVYMNEPGVSSLSPVDFRSLEHRSVADVATNG